MDRGACYTTTMKRAAGRTDLEAGSTWCQGMVALQLPKLIPQMNMADPLRGGSLFGGGTGATIACMFLMERRLMDGPATLDQTDKAPLLYSTCKGQWMGDGQHMEE